MGQLMKDSQSVLHLIGIAILIGFDISHVQVNQPRNWPESSSIQVARSRIGDVPLHVVGLSCNKEHQIGILECLWFGDGVVRAIHRSDSLCDLTEVPSKAFFEL